MTKTSPASEGGKATSVSSKMSPAMSLIEGLGNTTSPSLVSPGQTEYFDHSVFDDHQPHSSIHDFAGIGMEMADFQLDPSLDSHFAYQDEGHSDFHQAASNLVANSIGPGAGPSATPPSGGSHGSMLGMSMGMGSMGSMGMGMSMGMSMVTSSSGMFDSLHFEDHHNQHLMNQRYGSSHSMIDPHATATTTTTATTGGGDIQHHPQLSHMSFPSFNTVDHYVNTHSGGAKEIAAFAHHGHLGGVGGRSNRSGQWDLSRLDDFSMLLAPSESNNTSAAVFPLTKSSTRDMTIKKKKKTKKTSTTKSTKSGSGKKDKGSSRKHVATSSSSNTLTDDNAVWSVKQEDMLFSNEAGTQFSNNSNKASAPRRKKQQMSDREGLAGGVISNVTTESDVSSKKRQRHAQAGGSLAKVNKNTSSSSSAMGQLGPFKPVKTNKLTVDTLVSSAAHALASHSVATPGSTCSNFSNSCSTPGTDGHKPKQTSYFRGVSCCGKDRKWQARIRDANRVKYLGRYPTEVEAALVYDKAARECKGTTAPTNFSPLDSETVEKLKQAFVQYGEVPLYMHHLLAKSMRPRVENAMKRKAAASLANKNAGIPNPHIHGMGIMRGGLRVGVGMGMHMADPLAVAAAGAARAFNEAARLNSSKNNNSSSTTVTSSTNSNSSTSNLISPLNNNNSNNKNGPRMGSNISLNTPAIRTIGNHPHPFFPPYTPTGSCISEKNDVNKDKNTQSRLLLQSKATTLKSALQTRNTVTAATTSTTTTTTATPILAVIRKSGGTAPPESNTTPVRVNAAVTKSATTAVTTTAIATAPSKLLSPPTNTSTKIVSAVVPATIISKVGQPAIITPVSPVSPVSPPLTAMPTTTMTPMPVLAVVPSTTIRKISPVEIRMDPSGTFKPLGAVMGVGVGVANLPGSAGKTSDANGRPHSTMASPV